MIKAGISFGSPNMLSSSYLRFPRNCDGYYVDQAMATINLSALDGFDDAVSLGCSDSGIFQPETEYSYFCDAVNFKIILVGKFDQLRRGLERKCGAAP